MKAKINQIIENNGFEEAVLFDGMLAARVVLAAYGCQADAGEVKFATLGLLQDGKLVAKVKLDNPEINTWFAFAPMWIYESPRCPSVAGELIDFEEGVFQGSRTALGFDDPEWNLARDHEVKFNGIKILTGADALKPFGKRAVLVAK